MEITASCLDKYNVAKVVIRPPYDPRDIIDIELRLLSKESDGLIKGYMTMDKDGKYISRSYGSIHNSVNSSVSKSAQRRLRAGITQLSIQLIGALSND